MPDWPCFEQLPEKERGMGIGIAFKKDKFRLIQHDNFNLDVLGKIYNNKAYARPKPAMFCLLECLSTKKTFIVSNCHLLANWQMDYVKMA